jgi:peroxiredoxin
MAETASTMLPLGTPAPDFRLPDPDGREWTLADVRGGKGTLVMFICNHCPFVKHVKPELVRLGRELPERGIGVVAISANDVTTHPADAPDKMKREGYPFPYLYDESQDVARAYQAACTPDFFLFDADDKLVYRGQLDPSRPGNDVPVDGRDLRAAADTLLAGRPVPEDQAPSIGCNIKWKASAGGGA